MRERAGSSPATARLIGKLRTPLAFLTVGGAGALGYVLLSVLIGRTGLPAWAASITAYLLMIPPVYLAQRRVTFRLQGGTLDSFARYVASQGAGTAVSILLPAAVDPQGDAARFIVFAGVAVTVAVSNFLLLKLWVFSQP